MATQMELFDSGVSDELCLKGIEMYLKSPMAKRVEQMELSTEAAKVRWPLTWIAVTHTSLALLVLPLLKPLLDKGDMRAWQMLIVLVGFAAAYWGIRFWSLAAPLAAAIVGLLLYLSLDYAACAAQGPEHRPLPFAPVLGISQLVTIVLLVRAIRVGSRQRRLSRATLAPDGSIVSMPGGIASGIWLYLMLLSIVVLPMVQMPDYKFVFSDFFKVQRFMAIVIATWALIAWRDTLPAIGKFGRPLWYLLALLGGMGTALLAQCYLQMAHMILGVHPLKAAAPFLDHGYGFPIVVISVACFPAIFEELAFRGVIVPCLHRALTSAETVLVTGMMFMILHLSPFSAPHLLVVGCILGYIRLKTGSIWPCVLMHFTHNAIGLGIERWFG